MSERRDLKREETRRRVYEAALSVFRKDGLGCRIDDIARLAGVSRGTFYFHFPTKDDVLIERMRESEHDIADAIGAVPEDAPLLEVLDAVNRGLARAWQPEPSLLPDVAAAALRIAATHPYDQRSFALRATLGARFRIAQSRREILAVLPAEILSDIYLGNLLGGMLAWWARRDTDLHQVLSGVSLLFLRGAGPRPDLN